MEPLNLCWSVPIHQIEEQQAAASEFNLGELGFFPSHLIGDKDQALTGINGCLNLSGMGGDLDRSGIGGCLPGIGGCLEDDDEVQQLLSNLLDTECELGNLLDNVSMGGGWSRNPTSN